jgi:hypothetical protein
MARTLECRRRPASTPHSPGRPRLRARRGPASSTKPRASLHERAGEQAGRDAIVRLGFGCRPGEGRKDGAN